MHRYSVIVAGALALSLSLSWPARADDGQVESKHPSQVGERLTCEGSWVKMAAATAVMEIVR